MKRILILVIVMCFCLAAAPNLFACSGMPGWTDYGIYREGEHGTCIRLEQLIEKVEEQNDLLREQNKLLKEQLRLMKRDSLEDIVSPNSFVPDWMRGN
jgi:hypothetical protein